MKEREPQTLLLRNIPPEIYEILERNAKDHHRSKNQEAIEALRIGLTSEPVALSRPSLLKWKKPLTDTFIQDAMDEGRP